MNLTVSSNSQLPKHLPPLDLYRLSSLLGQISCTLGAVSEAFLVFWSHCSTKWVSITLFLMKGAFWGLYDWTPLVKTKNHPWTSQHEVFWGMFVSFKSWMFCLCSSVFMMASITRLNLPLVLWHLNMSLKFPQLRIQVFWFFYFITYIHKVDF